jgi:uncharacterized repeat protein (TIGR01451 family)
MRWMTSASQYFLLAILCCVFQATAFAQVNLATTVQADKAVYESPGTGVITVRMSNRGPEAAVNAQFFLQVPGVSAAAQGIDIAGITCTANLGAVCPTAFSRPGSRTLITATVPLLPVDSSLVLTIPVAFNVMVVDRSIVRAEISPTAPQTLGANPANVSEMPIQILPRNVQYSVNVVPVGSGAPTPGSQISFDVTVLSTGKHPANVKLDLYTGSQTNPPQPPNTIEPQPFLAPTLIRSISCLSASGGASCANVQGIDVDGYRPGGLPLLNAEESFVALLGMPGTLAAGAAGSSIVLRVMVDLPQPGCSSRRPLPRQELRLTAEVRDIRGAPDQRADLVTPEFPSSPADNGDYDALVSLTAPACFEGNLSVSSITEPAAQTTGGINALANFSYSATYTADASNTGPAEQVPLSFAVTWPTAGSASISNLVQCTASGGAVCPTAYTVMNSRQPYPADPGVAQGEIIRVSAVSPQMPPGSSLVLQFSGVAGPDDQLNRCRPLVLAASAMIPNPNPQGQRFGSFKETGPLTDNSRGFATTANVGRGCGDSFEVASTITGPWLDRAATQLAPQPLAPGQMVYFKSRYTNLSTGPDRVSLTRYQVNTVANMPTIASNGVLLSTEPYTTLQGQGFVQDESGPVGYQFWDWANGGIAPRYKNLQSGVTCEASGGATCPQAPYLGAILGTTQGNFTNVHGWASEPYFSLVGNPRAIAPPNPTLTPWPVGGGLEFTQAYRVGSVDPRQSRCANTETIFRGTVTATISAMLTSPAASERNLVPNSAFVNVSVSVPPCAPNQLEVSQVFLPSRQTTVDLPLNRTLRQEIVIRNTGPNNLDLPQFALYFAGVQDSRIQSITCTGTSGGAQCPTLPANTGFSPGGGVYVQQDDYNYFGNVGPRVYFGWGSPGASTMPPGSSVTFEATIVYVPRVNQNVLINYATFQAQLEARNAPWLGVQSSIRALTVASVNQLLVQKRVSAVRVAPGETVTYTLDAMNLSTVDMVNPVLVDPLPNALLGTNPTGFANVRCQVLTEADDVLVGAVNPVACPPIMSDVSGLRAQFGIMPPNSGVRITFTAKAPQTSTFEVSNTARFASDETRYTRSDSDSTVNFLTRAIGSVQGTVWRDLNHDRNIGANEPRVGGIRVEALQNGVVVKSAMSDPVTGAYLIEDLLDGRYDIRFIDAASNTIYGKPKSADPSCISCNGDTNSGLIRGVTISTGVIRINQDLPLDPSGVVYDAVTRQPLGGASVTLIGADNLPVPGACIVGGQNPQTTSLASAVPGGYQFDVFFNAGCPGNGTYRLQIVPPANYTAPSTLLPPSSGIFDPSNVANCQVGSILPGNCLVQAQASAPTAGQATSYWFAFSLSSGGNGVLNNHVPLDPSEARTLLISKAVAKRVVELGDSVKYTVKVRYAAGVSPLPFVRVVDSMPAGFKLIPGTSFVSVPTGFAPMAIPAGNISGAPGAVVTYNIPLPGGLLTVGQELELSYRVRVGVGSLLGDGINRAQAFSIGTTQSNIATAKVKVNPGVFTSEACIVGKIYTDCNNNHIQDAEEVGVPGVRLYLQDGTYLVSDSEGKYSICGLEPKSHVLKVDQITLPRGSRLTTTSNRNLGNADSLWLDLKNGEMQQADFAIGSCSNTVLEQVKARRAQGEVRSVDNENKGGAALKFEGKSANYPDQGTDGANQPLAQPRPPQSPGALPRGEAENNTPVPQLPAASSNTPGNNIRLTK